ncbi:HNH endonuclease [Fictibacillus sp. 18YEL24]|uniref:HNH endonuclease n=1 Tax=Fictibacillus sp. 18YEL24 TaxID=2745875 RepID=UPI001E3FDE7E|nr:HNH endonuclease [Fictibacillus sp. 18YEL24]
MAVNRREELEERGHKNARRVWLVPANADEYDLECAFYQHDVLHWKRSFNYEEGDILFIYVSGHIQQVRYKVEVIKGIVSPNEINFDDHFWIDKTKYHQSKDWNYTRIRLLNKSNDEGLSFNQLREHGLKGNMQGSMKITGDLRNYIMSFFKGDLTNELYPDEVPLTLEEGKRREVSVNVYERNPLARKKCIDYHGVNCSICDLNFKEMYGEVGNDFIHVHHIVPLHQIKQDYVVDPQHDLIPVCPNCHAMLHRKEEVNYLSINQLRERVENLKFTSTR